jgi:K+-sensing histidine kinase KdpD
MARDAAIRLGAKVKELISLSNIEPVGSDLDLEEVDMADIVEDVTREMIADFERKKLVVAVEDRTGGRVLRADSGKLTYVVRSVIDHVMQSTDRGGTVDIAWSASDVGPEGDDAPWFVLRVSGGGSPGRDDAIEAILDSLAAEHGDTAGPPADSGLTLSEYILDFHGGLLVADEENAGVISVWLPLGY